MEEDKTITITTKIPIEVIVNKVVEENPQTECEFNNLLIYNFTNELLEKLRIQLDQQRGGKKKKTRKSRKSRKSKKTKRSNKTKKIRNQKGGVDPRLIIFFASMFLVFVKGIKNMTDSDVIKRVKQVNEVSDLFRNYYGTCTLNTMLFLKTIDLPTFADLSIDMMTNSPGLTNREMVSYLNKDLNFNSKWISLSGRTGELDEVVENFIEKVINKLIKLRSDYGFEPTQSIITAMNYVKKGERRVGHSVVLWLTGNNELIIIEPQRIQRFGLILYTSETSFDRYMFDDKEIKRGSLRQYIRENIDIQNELSDVDIFASMHLEIEDARGIEEFTPKNKRIIDTIARIKGVEETMKDKTRIEF